MPPKHDPLPDVWLDGLEQTQSELLQEISNIQTTNEQRFREQQLASEQRIDNLAKEMRQLFDALHIAPTTAPPPSSARRVDLRYTPEQVCCHAQLLPRTRFWH